MSIINLELEQGIPYTFSKIYSDTSTGLGIDLSLYTCKLIGRSSPIIDPEILLSTETGEITLSSSGLISITFPSSSTLTQDWFQIPYDVILTDPSLNYIKFCKGIITLLPSQLVS